MPRSTTIRDNLGSRTYHGFDQKFLPASEVNTIAIVLVEGEPQLFALDERKTAAGLLAYLCGEYGDPEGRNIRIVGVFSRSK